MIPITASKVMEEEDLQHTVKLSSYIFGCRIPDPTYLGKLFGSKCHHIDIRLYAAWINGCCVRNKVTVYLRHPSHVYMITYLIIRFFQFKF